MIPLNAPVFNKLAAILDNYDRKSTISILAGLLTVPALQANTIRIETLVHLAVAHCRGRRKAGLPEISNWLNTQLGDSPLAELEDPAEDVFITNVCTPEGNRRILTGIWESNDYFAQMVIECLVSPSVPEECRYLLIPIFALLRLSDFISNSFDMSRWHLEPSTPKGSIHLSSSMQLAERAQVITFPEDELESLDINPEMLTPFTWRDVDKQMLESEFVGNSSLEKRPLINFGNDYVLALPHAISPAIRRFVLTELKRLGYLQSFANQLAILQSQQVEKEGLQELKGNTVSVECPKPDGNIPSIHTWLLKYDTNKYLHVVLIHDHLVWLEKQGLMELVLYPPAIQSNFYAYLNKVAEHCCSLPDYHEGMTLLVLGGLGRGFALRNIEWPDFWRFSAIRISDLLMLAGEIDRPINSYLKCIKQKGRAEEKGVRFLNTNGDYNFYCFWRLLDYQLVPREIPVCTGSMIGIGTDMVRQIRKEVRDLTDYHVVQRPDRSFSTVIRFGRDAYFKSVQNRPIYASIGHFRSGTFSGAVETFRGASWLTIAPRIEDNYFKPLLYEIWSGLIGLYDKLLLEIESLFPEISDGAIEIVLIFDELESPDEESNTQSNSDIDEPRIVFNLDKSTANIIFPSNFLYHFQQPLNSGERAFLRSIAKSLLGLHQVATENNEETILDNLMHKVLGIHNARIIHLFPSRHSTEYLLAGQPKIPFLLAQEDFIFSKLRLSEGCTDVHPGNSIKLKSECNEFLHKVVDKVWNRLRDLLQQLDRSSVIQEAFKVFEAVLQDRDHWDRTAQAVLALYSPEDDVITIAQKRASDRNNASVPARAILEMAICECPSVGGRTVSSWDMDDLFTKAALLIDVATDSDALNAGLIEPPIELHLNGDYSIDRTFHDTVIDPFVTAIFREGFGDSVEEYENFYQVRPSDMRIRADDVFAADFINAFHAEFGLKPDEAINGLRALLDYAVDSDNVIVVTTLSDIKVKLNTVGGLSDEASMAFINSFSIFHRPAWETPPSGFKEKDLYPWRFRRRLASIARPIFSYGRNEDDTVIYGAGSLFHGFKYLLSRSEEGHLPQEFFVSDEMKHYIGAVNNTRGHDFSSWVSDQFCLKGWKTRVEVQMTELGGSPVQGDVDVLAWKPSGDILIIECKRLQFARTVAEIAEICHRFRGEVKDELGKHVERINWIRANPECLERVIGFMPSALNINDRLVTNTQVPMMYLTSLPIATDMIGPLK